MNIQKQSAFTLVEAMITLTVLAILIAVGLPNLSGFLQDNRLTSHTNTLVATLNYARGEAITRNSAVNITAVDSSDSDNEWGPGWTLWVNNPLNGNATIDADEIIREFRLNGVTMINGPDDLTVKSLTDVDASLKSKTLSYRGDGTLATTAVITSFTICDNRPYEKGREIEISRIGRTILADDQYSCP